jgi:hypothetical protein
MNSSLSIFLKFLIFLNIFGLLRRTNIKNKFLKIKIYYYNAFPSEKYFEKQLLPYS